MFVNRYLRLCLIPISLAISASPCIASKSDLDQLKGLYASWEKAFNAKDVRGVMSFYDADGFFAFDVAPPREYRDLKSYKKDYEGLFAMPGTMATKIDDLHITVAGSVAYSHGSETIQMTSPDGSKSDMVLRFTDVFRKRHGKWAAVEEHVSIPVDLTTGKPDFMSKP